MEKIIAELIRSNTLRTAPTIRQWYRTLIYIPPSVLISAALHTFDAPFVGTMVAVFSMQVAWHLLFGRHENDGYVSPGEGI